MPGTDGMEQIMKSGDLLSETTMKSIKARFAF